MAKQTNGSAQRQCQSWIESFVKWGGDLETPEVFRRWGAIATVGAVLEQRVFFANSGILFPNLYVMLIGPPGVGKSRTIRPLRKLARELEGFHISPNDLTGAALAREMKAAEREIQPSLLDGKKPVYYNSLFMMPDDLQSTMAKYDNDLVSKMTIFYDSDPYAQVRVTRDVDIEIESPQLSILAGTTDSQLLETLPDGAWEQGFMSRTIMVFSGEKIKKDNFFSDDQIDPPKELSHDLKAIFGLHGQLTHAREFDDAFNTWRRNDCRPFPSHRRLQHYRSRREIHLLKLAMVSCADRSDALSLDLHDFQRAKSWLEEAERTMPFVFERAVTADAGLMLELVDGLNGKAVMEHSFKRSIMMKFKGHLAPRILDIMLDARMVEVSEPDKKGFRWVRKSDSGT